MSESLQNRNRRIRGNRAKAAVAAITLAAGAARFAPPAVDAAADYVLKGPEDSAHEINVRINSGESQPVTVEVNNLDVDTPKESTPDNISEAVALARKRQAAGEDIGVLSVDDAIALHKFLTGRDTPLAGEHVVVGVRDTDITDATETHTPSTGSHTPSP